MQPSPGSGELEVTFPLNPLTYRIRILDTDYDGFASTYSCYRILGLFNFEMAWLLTRDQEPSDDVVRVHMKR